ncbi:MAG: DUF4383 domain-containing protein [Acidimicrobiia bacterium]
MAAQSTTPNQKLSYLFAAVYAVVGALGFTVTGDTNFGAAEGAKLLGIFGVNPFHNFIHIGLGLLFLIGGSSGYVGARGMNLILGGILIFAGIYGFITSGSGANFIGANAADNILHLGSGAVLIMTGMKKDYPAPAATT